MQTPAPTDVKLKMRAERIGLCRALEAAVVPDALEFRASGNRRVSDVTERMRRRKGVLSRPDSRAMERLGKARSLLAAVSQHSRPSHPLGPVHDSERELGLVSLPVNRPHGLDTRHDTKDTIVPSSGRLRVEVASHGGGRAISLPRADGKHVPHRIHPNIAS